MWYNNVNTNVLGPVHTNPFSNENGAVLLRVRLTSTLQRRKRSPKTEPYENALQSGAIWKRCPLKTLFSSVDGGNDAVWKRWRHQNHSTVSIQNWGYNSVFKQIRRCSVGGRKRYKNDKCGRKSFWKRSKNSSVFVWKLISVDRALNYGVWQVEYTKTTKNCFTSRKSQKQIKTFFLRNNPSVMGRQLSNDEIII